MSLADGIKYGAGNCPECFGYGEIEEDDHVVDWVRGGYIDGQVLTCPRCDGNGEIDVEDDE